MKCYDIVTKIQDYTDLVWSEKSVSSNTSGCFLKAKKPGSDGIMRYFKLSNYDSYRGIFGYECVYELVASRLLNILGVEHLQYKLVHANVKIDGKIYETYLCESKDFKQDNERKIALDIYYDLEKQNDETPLQFCDRSGWHNQIRKMMLADFLMINRDRHGANIEVLISKNSVRLAPLFDNGLSFFAPYCGAEDKIKNFDPMEDIPVNNYLGTRSLFENLGFIDDDLTDEILDFYKEDFLAGLDEILSKEHIEKVWEVIWKRWNYYESIRNQRR